MLTKIADNKRDDIAITKVYDFIISTNGNLHPKRTTQVYKLLVECRDGSFYWVPLNDIKQFNPVELAEYSVTN